MKNFNHCLQKSGAISVFVALFFCLFLTSRAQDTTLIPDKLDLGSLSGSFQVDAQNYFQDSLIGTPNFPQKIGMNGFMNLYYTRGNFSAGVRYEAYMPTLQGFVRNTGSGIPYRFARYRNDKLDITLGNFYEQFGSGMIFRSYEAWGLGFDNVMDGASVKLTGLKGVVVKGIIGRQRNAFSYNTENQSEGLVRGADGEVLLNDLLGFSKYVGTQMRIGASVVSRYQKDNDPVYVLPENVAAFAGRAQVSNQHFNFYAEGAYKINDPSTVNNRIYKPGTGLFVQGGYFEKGLGISISAKRIDNMDYRSERSATFNNLMLNFLPPMTKQHSYRLATLFPYATQANGELGFQGEVSYKIPKKTSLGGKYGTAIALNYSNIHGLERTANTTDSLMGYTTTFFGVSEHIYYEEINLEITKTFSKKLKGSMMLMNVIYDKDLFKQLTGFFTTSEVHSFISIVDMSYKIKPKQTLRTELQHAYTKNEFGSWAMALVEYTFAPHWFIAAFDEYNYGNYKDELQIHYFTGQAGFLWESFRVTAGYGRQRAGVICVGGVCRNVPASNGFQVSVSGTF